MGYRQPTSPNLDKLAAESLTFERFHANFNLTKLCLAAMNGYPTVYPPGPTFIDALANGGYHDRAFISFWPPSFYGFHGFTTNHVTLSGMDSPLYQLFARVLPEPDIRWLAGLLTEDLPYFCPYTSGYDTDLLWQTNHFPIEYSLKAALDYLKQHRQGAFVWIHLWPPHSPYHPPEDTLGLFGPVPQAIDPFLIHKEYDPSQDEYVAQLKNLYDSTVFDDDRKIGAFIDSLKTEGLFDSSYLIFASDHGESFERGFVGHSSWALLEAITHVPLVIHRPGDKTRIKIQTFAQQLDLAPTLLDMLGLPIPKELPGESLVPYIKNPEKLSQRYKMSVSMRAYLGQGGQLAVYQNVFKLVFLSNTTARDTIRLFNLFNDPDARTDISAQHPELIAPMMKVLNVNPPQP